MRRSVAVTAAAGIALVAVLSSALALPQYSKKEKKPCIYCHVKPAGGMPLTAAGKYYKAHGHSFKGYKPGKPGKKPGKPGSMPANKPPKK